MERLARRRILAWICLIVSFGACTSVASAATPKARTFSMGITPGSAPLGIAPGWDGNLWFTEDSGNRIGQITPSGAVTEFSAGITAGASPEGIVAGPDGNVWFTEDDGNRIGRITPSGTITEFSAGIVAGGSPEGIAAGHDGNLWFTEDSGNRIGQSSPGGAVTEFTAGISPASTPQGIAMGPDGNLWFTQRAGNRIARITPTGTVTQFPLPTPGNGPYSITAGPDGNLWFTEPDTDQIGRITPSGTITEFPLPAASSFPFDITAGPDGNLWFTEAVGHRIGRITPSGTISEFNDGLTDSGEPSGIATGPDGNLWFAENNADRIGRMNTAVDPPRYTDPGRIDVPATGTSGAAGPYPATIEASGLQGTVTEVSVRLNGIHHSFASDIDALLVGPQGQKVLVVADSNQNIAREVLTGPVVTLDDDGVFSPKLLTSGIFKPIHPSGLASPFPGPAPAGPYSGSLSAFDGSNPNGVWRLFVQDDSPSDAGVISGGWSLDITTTAPPPVQVPGPTVTRTVTPRADTTKPSLKLAKLATRTTQKAFRKGPRFRVTPSEPVTLDISLSAKVRRATIARLQLFERTRRASGATTIRAKPSARLLGRPKKTFKARLRIVATDSAGNRTTVNRTISVRPDKKRKR